MDPVDVDPFGSVRPQLLLLTAFVLLGGAPGCSLFGSDACSAGCVDSDGTCRQLSNTTCGAGGAACVDCTLEGKVCTGNGACVTGTWDPPPPPPQGPYCQVDQGDPVGLGQACDAKTICQRVRGGLKCVDRCEAHPKECATPTQLRSCKNTCSGCCTLDARCLEDLQASCAYCDDENAASGRCESPMDRCKRTCLNGCCARDGSCVGGTSADQCGTNAAECATCSAASLACDVQTRTCTPPSIGSGTLRVCLRNITLAGERSAIDPCGDGSSSGAIAAEVELSVGNDAASRSALVASAYGTVTGAGASFDFVGECFYVSEDEGVELVDIRLFSRDGVPGGTGDSADRTTCSQYLGYVIGTAAFEACVRDQRASRCLPLRGVPDQYQRCLSGSSTVLTSGACASTSDLGRCVGDMRFTSSSASGLGQPITVTNCFAPAGGTKLIQSVRLEISAAL